MLIDFVFKYLQCGLNISIQKPKLVLISIMSAFIPSDAD